MRGEGKRPKERGAKTVAVKRPVARKMIYALISPFMKVTRVSREVNSVSKNNHK